MFGQPARLAQIGLCAALLAAAATSASSQSSEVFAGKSVQLIVGSTGVGTGTHAYPKALNELIGMKFRIVGGFPSSAEVFLAMERGEVDGICESLDSIKNRRPDWIPRKTVAVLFQGGARPNP